MGKIVCANTGKTKNVPERVLRKNRGVGNETVYQKAAAAIIAFAILIGVLRLRSI